MIENLDSLNSIIEDSSFPEKTKKRLKELVVYELTGRSQKDFRDFIATQIQDENKNDA